MKSCSTECIFIHCWGHLRVYCIGTLFKAVAPAHVVLSGHHAEQTHTSPIERTWTITVVEVDFYARRRSALCSTDLVGHVMAVFFPLQWVSSKLRGSIDVRQHTWRRHYSIKLSGCRVLGEVDRRRHTAAEWQLTPPTHIVPRSPRV
jgi:hypothetical protein